MSAEHSQAEITPATAAGGEDHLLVREFLSHREDHREAGRVFDRLVLKYRDRIFSLCYRMLGDYEDANDCAQEVFIKVFRNMEGFRFQSSFSTWLYRIAVNTCKNQLTSKVRRNRDKTFRMDQTIGDADLPLNPGTTEESPDRLFEKGETERIVQRAIETLPPQQRLLVVLRDIEGRPYEEIASITGTALGTVKSRLNRAREQLKTLLEEELSNEL